MKNNKFMFLSVIGSLVFAIAFVATPAFAQTNTFSQISGSSTLKVGSKGAAVTALQQFLSSDKDIYPDGRVTGYFGSMTKAAAIQFQLSYNLTADGVVGAMTRNKVNNLISAGRGIDIYSPSIYNLSVVPNGRNVNITFNSNEMVKAAVFYDTNAINWSNWDDSVPSLDIPAISGTTNVDSTFSQSKQFTLSNLSPNTVYNYTLVAIDQSGNTSVIWPTRFTTGQ